MKAENNTRCALTPRGNTGIVLRKAVACRGGRSVRGEETHGWHSEQEGSSLGGGLPLINAEAVSPGPLQPLQALFSWQPCSSK